MIITNVAWIVPLITVLLLLAILWLLYRTRYGMAIRAVAFDVNTVRLMGIDANRIISLVFALGSSLAALGGVFYSISYPTIDPLMGVLIGLKAFAAAVLGGIGSVTGAVLGGFILGFTEVVAVALFPELGGYKDAFAFMFLILVLLFRRLALWAMNVWKGAVSDAQRYDYRRGAAAPTWSLLLSASRCWPGSTSSSTTTLFASSAPFSSL